MAQSPRLYTKRFLYSSIWEISLLGVLALTIISLGITFLPAFYLLGAVVSVATLWLVLKTPKRTLFTYILSIILVQIRPRELVGGVSPLDTLFGGVMIVVIIKTVVDIALLRRSKIIYNKYQLSALIFLLWSLVAGFIFVVAGETEAVHILRELLRMSPIIVIPSLLPRALSDDRKAVNHFFIIMMMVWIIVQVATVFYVRSSFMNAFYLFQVGFALFDVANSAFMIFIFLAMAMSTFVKNQQRYYFLLVLISCIGLALTFNRTTWLTTVILLVPFMMLFPREQKKIGVGIVVKLILVFISVTTIVYFLVPLVQLLLKWFLVRFLSSGMGKADASIANRFVEWENVWNNIISSPALGLGLGGRYSFYSPYIGVKISTGYTHNGLLGALLKGGFIGAGFLFYAYFGFIQMGRRIASSSLYSMREKALTRAGIIFLIFCIFFSLTFNVFIHREVLWYITLIWGYFIYLEQSKKHIDVNKTIFHQ